VRLTLPHYYDFGSERELVGDNLLRPEAWDALRTQSSGPFSLPATRAEFERVATERDDLRLRAEAIDAWLTDQGVERLVSYGAGGASLEYWLHSLTPERKIVVTDYAPATVERLRSVFPEVETYRHDLLADLPLDGDMHMFHRIDTEFTNRQMRAVLQRFRERRVLLVAAEIADLRRVITELRALPYNLRRRSSRAGVMRTAGAFEALWRGTHQGNRLQLHNFAAWSLEPR
jgi:hypothetical protein